MTSSTTFRAGDADGHFPAKTSLENAPDLSLMAKARAGFHGPYGLGLNQLFKGMGGPEYIASLLTGYTGRGKEEAARSSTRTRPSRAAISRWRRRSGKMTSTYETGTGRRRLPDLDQRLIEQMAQDVACLPDVGGRAER
jgi:hypothetical protein